MTRVGGTWDTGGHAVRRGGMTGSGWKCVKSPLWLRVGKLGKAECDPYEAGCGVGPAERCLEWQATVGMTEEAKFQRDGGSKIQTVAC